MIWTFVTFPFGSKDKRKRPVPETPPCETPGGKAGAGTKSIRGFGVGFGVGEPSADASHRGRVSEVTLEKSDASAAELRAIVLSPADVTTPTTAPASSTTGEPAALAGVVPRNSKSLPCSAAIVISRALPSFPANALPITTTLAPTGDRKSVV